MTINDAIYMALMSQFKKDIRPEALTMIKDAGFDLYKCNGHFYIENTRTGRYLYIDHSNRYGLDIRTYGRRYFKVHSIKYGRDNCKFDFAGYLNKPLNEEWYSRFDREYQPTAAKYRKLLDARNSVKFDKDRIIRIKKQIASLTADLEREIRYQVESEVKLNNTRKELGLVK